MTKIMTCSGSYEAPLLHKPLYSLSIGGRCMVKKNTAKQYGRNRVYSVKFTQWERLAMIAITKSKRPETGTIDKPVNLQINFYFKNRSGEADVSNLIEGVQDVLVKMRILEDDKLVYRVTAEKFFDHEPCTELVIWGR